MKKSKLNTFLLLSSFMGFALSGPGHAKVYDYTDGNRLTLLQDARDAVAFKMDLVRKAKHHIHIMTYYWDNNGYPLELMQELKKAHDRGVDVRIITTYLPSLAMDLFGKAKKVLNTGNKSKESSAVLAFMRLGLGNNQPITTNIHEKIFLVDGEVAILGGRNISDNDYRAKDLEVKLEGAVVNQVQQHFQKMFSFMVERKIEDKCNQGKKYYTCASEYNALKFEEGDRAFFPDQPQFEEGSRARILTNELLFQEDRFKRSGEDIFNIKDDIIDTVIQTPFTKMRTYNYFIIPTDRYKKYLESNLAQGKSIEIMTNSKATAAAISDKGYLLGLPEMKNLVTRGLKLHLWNAGVKHGEDELLYLHEKVMLFDDDHGIIGSHNFGKGSTSVSSEISVEFFSKPVVQTLVDVYEKEFQDEKITTDATLPMLDREIQDNKKMIRFLQTGFIKNLLSELY
ncbi:MAG: phospholipase D-like domain-containing protein [Bacteriovorax sp.]